MEYPQFKSNPVFVDHRGTFAPLSLQTYDKNWLQSNISFNPQIFTLRGLHFQVGEKAQAKLIKVITGSIIDFIVDIREDSPEYMKLYHYNMKPGDELLVPRGFAHGFMTTSFNTIVQYLVDNDYSPESEGSIYWKEVDGLYDILNSYSLLFDLTDEIIVISDKDYITKNFKIRNDGE
jgi:dTDP-4-dehydrorhamnose 3,5-epimerase